MKAYNLSMLMICINLGAFIMSLTGSFGDMGTLSSRAESMVSNPIITTAALASIVVAITVSSTKILGSQLSSPTAVSVGYFSVAFWGSFTLCAGIVFDLPVEGASIFGGIFTLIAILIFVMTLIQMPTGGQKSYE